MNKRRSAKPAPFAAGLFFLSTVPAIISAQSSPPPPTTTETPHPRAKQAPVPTDIFAGLQYTEDQKAKISKIHEDIKSRMDTVIKDDKLSPDQKGAFLQGFERMERSEVYKVLTPEQQTEVLKRMRALREQKELEKKKAPPPG